MNADRERALHEAVAAARAEAERIRADRNVWFSANSAAQAALGRVRDALGERGRVLRLAGIDEHRGYIEISRIRAALADDPSPSEERGEFCAHGWHHDNPDPCPGCQALIPPQPSPSDGGAEEREVHRNDYYDGDGFVYCQECYEALDDYVLVTDCASRPAPTEGDA